MKKFFKMIAMGVLALLAIIFCPSARSYMYFPDEY